MPEAATALAPKPAAATPAPAPAPATPAPSKPAPNPANAGEGDFDAFLEIDKAMESSDVLKSDPDDKPVEKPATKKDPLTGEDTDEPEEKAEEKPAEKPSDDKEKRTFKQKSEGGKLREERDRIAKELEAERTAKRELEERVKTAKPAEEVTKLAERLAAIERERDEARAEAMMLKQEVSPEFKEKYEKPFNEAAEVASELISQFHVTQADGTTRAANWASDFGGIYNLPYVEAKKRAQEMFGDEAQTVMGVYNQLHSLEKVANKAKEAEKAKWKETTAAQAANQAKEREAYQAAHAAARDGLIKKYPDRFGDDPADPEVGKALAQGRKLLESQPKTFQEAAAMNAAKELAIVSHPRLVLQAKKLTAEVASLKAKLAEYEGSEPGKGKRKATTDAAPVDDEEAELRALRAVR